MAGLHPHLGGPTRTVTGLVSALSKLRYIDVDLLSQTHFEEDVYLGRLAESEVLLSTLNTGSQLKGFYAFSRFLTTAIDLKRPDILHDHGLWLPTNHAVSRASRAYRIPLVLHARGMLHPWALSHRAAKKRLAWWAYQRRSLQSVSLFFATSNEEADHIRDLSLKQPIAIIPNGIDLPEVKTSLENSARETDKRSVLFMGRIHPIKGIIELLEAWKDVRRDDWRLLLAGPDEDGHLNEVMNCVGKLGLVDCVEYLGKVDEEDKAALFSRADIFVLPSFSENFGVVVAEALAHRVPVVATYGSPWRGLVENSCGWWVRTEAKALGGALSEAMALSDEERSRMGLRGQRYARKFEWTHIARETADVYLWLLGRADRPDCVRLG